MIPRWHWPPRPEQAARFARRAAHIVTRRIAAAEAPGNRQPRDRTPPEIAQRVECACGRSGSPSARSLRDPATPSSHCRFDCGQPTLRILVAAAAPGRSPSRAPPCVRCRSSILLRLGLVEHVLAFATSRSPRRRRVVPRAGPSLRPCRSRPAARPRCCSKAMCRRAPTGRAHTARAAASCLSSSRISAEPAPHLGPLPREKSALIPSSKTSRPLVVAQLDRGIAARRPRPPAFQESLRHRVRLARHLDRALADQLLLLVCILGHGRRVPLVGARHRTVAAASCCICAVFFVAVVPGRHRRIRFGRGDLDLLLGLDRLGHALCRPAMPSAMPSTVRRPPAWSCRATSTSPLYFV